MGWSVGSAFLSWAACCLILQVSTILAGFPSAEAERDTGLLRDRELFRFSVLVVLGISSFDKWLDMGRLITSLLASICLPLEAGLDRGRLLGSRPVCFVSALFLTLDGPDEGRTVRWEHVWVALTLFFVIGRFSFIEELELGRSGWQLLVGCCLCPVVGLDVGLFECPLVVVFAPTVVSDELFFKEGLEWGLFAGWLIRWLASFAVLRTLSFDDLEIPLDSRFFTDWEFAGPVTVVIFALLLVLGALFLDVLDNPLDSRLFTDWQLAVRASVVVVDVFPWSCWEHDRGTFEARWRFCGLVVVALLGRMSFGWGELGLDVTFFETWLVVSLLRVGLDALCLSEVLEFSPLEFSKKKHKHNSY